MSQSQKSQRLKPLKHPLDLAVCQKAARYAVRVFEEMSKRSELLREEGQVAKFERDEILPFLGDLLGKGGFNNVYELERIQLRDGGTEEVSSHTATTSSLRKELVQNKHKLAVKFLSDEAMYSPEEFCNGAADLLMEAKYLTALAAHPHPALIQLHGISAAGPQGFQRTDRAGFFLVIDRLYDTLDRRIDVWKEVKRRKNHIKSNDTQKHQIMRALFLQRLLVAQDIASALRHLHKLSVIFRDLKPDNVGFDYGGRVKLFDFGLAKELDPLQQTDNGLYNMSGGTGSRRFMAPEVSLSEPYDLSADMYSFSILFWELLTLEKAFSKMPVDEHREKVIKNNERLPTDPAWGKVIEELLEGCWRRSPFKRPSAKEAYKILRQEIQSIVAEEFPQQAVEEERRKSLGTSHS